VGASGEARGVRPPALGRLAAPLALALALVAPSGARAQTTNNPSWAQNQQHKYESPQWFAFELKFGSYSPHIDASPGLNGKHPFADLFNPQGTYGQPPGRLLTSIEFDVQFLHKFGSLGAGLSVGYYRRTTHAFQYLDLQGTQCMVPNCVRSGDITALNMLPVEALLVYRFDVMALRWRVPLVPYLKIGMAYYFWWIENGTGGIAKAFTNPTMPGTSPTVDGWGGTLGWVLNPGLAFLLDVLEPQAARGLDGELGINHTYLFAELHYTDINFFHRGGNNTLDLSDVSFNCGLAFEF
jgi:hypothetical protein